MINFYDLFASPVFWAIIVAVIAAQGVKIVLLVFKQRQKFIWEDLFVTGSMPSAHAAIVVSLVVILLLTEGFSPLFFVSFVFAAIVIRDAVGVRRTVGEESKVLTNVITVLKTKFHIAISRKMHQSLGHQPIEVFVGTLIGIASAIVVYLAL
ncbi:divergent PAP2 family protein [Candidatus Woesearchaeota archaeon]|nr:divergent PAP2 family protein [Candidatus Woesearchaeota archaeon]